MGIFIVGRHRSSSLPVVAVLGLLTVAGFLSNLVDAQAQCNACSAMTNLACVSRTQFQVCDVNGFPSGPVNSCPTGYVCSTANLMICQPNTATVPVACDNCNICDRNNTFACTGARTYALCLGTTVPSEITGSCSPFHVCSIDYPYICGNGTQGVSATCSFLENDVTTTTTTTPTPTPTTPATTTTEALPPVDPTVFCRLLKELGRFPRGNDIATTCRQYIYCFVNNNIWTGTTYTCPGGTFFNSASRICDTLPPNRCITTQQTLVFRNMELE